MNLQNNQAMPAINVANLITLVSQTHNIINTPQLGDKVWVQFAGQEGVIQRVIGKQLDIMFDNGTFIQTSDQSVEKYTIKEENKNSSRTICSNYSVNHSPVAEKRANLKQKQLSLF